METCAQIADQLWRTFDGQAWHGDSITRILTGIEPQQAAQKALQNVHSIWEIVLHNYCLGTGRHQMLAGKSVHDDPRRGRLAPVRESTADEWETAVKCLTDTTSTLNALISAFPEQQLHEKVPGQPFTYYQLFYGVVQHNLYHAGQIGILKKL